LHPDSIDAGRTKLELETFAPCIERKGCGIQLFEGDDDQKENEVDSRKAVSELGSLKGFGQSIDFFRGFQKCKR
jgi:hypothetical protein